MEIYLIEKRRIYLIMRLFECSIGTFPIIHIPESNSLAYKHKSIQSPNRALSFPFVKWAAVVQSTKSERCDVCSCGLSLSNDFHNLFNRKLHTWYKTVYRSLKPKVSQLLFSPEWNYSIHDKSNSTKIRLKRTGKLKTFSNQINIFAKEIFGIYMSNSTFSIELRFSNHYNFTRLVLFGPRFWSIWFLCRFKDSCCCLQRNFIINKAHPWF